MSEGVRRERMSTSNVLRRWGRIALRGMLCLALALLIGSAFASVALAQTPGDVYGPLPEQTPGGGVDGPWLDIFQVFWFTDAPDFEHTDKGATYGHNAARRFDYGKDRHPQCYYYSDEGPDADWVNALYDMMSCRVGLVVGALTWFGVAIALMALAWAGLMWITDSDAGSERTVALRNMITGPLLGMLLLFFTYTFAKWLYAVIKYNFDRYINLNYWS